MEAMLLHLEFVVNQDTNDAQEEEEEEEEEEELGQTVKVKVD
jgi:hypothetical protein